VTALIRSLEEYEQIIERGLATFIEVGNALLTIRAEKLYLESHDSFADYCRQRWFLARPRAYELMQAAEVAGAVSEISDIAPPSRESHAAELAPLREDPAAMAAAWTEAVDRHDQPTAKQVREVVQERQAQDDRHDDDVLEEATPALTVRQRQVAEKAKERLHNLVSMQTGGGMGLREFRPIADKLVARSSKILSGEDVEDMLDSLDLGIAQARYLQRALRERTERGRP
jgi:hypothetical protein